jgi:hypothetical protein
MNYELEIIWKEAGVPCLKILSCIHVAGLSKTNYFSIVAVTSETRTGHFRI